MSSSRKQRVWQAIAFLLPVLVALRLLNAAGESEFSGGSLTGRLLNSCEAGVLLFLIAMLVSFLYPRFAAVIGGAAALLSLPFHLYLVVPGFFHEVFGGEYSVPLQAGFVWNTSALLGILTVAIAAFVGFRSFWLTEKTPST